MHVLQLYVYYSYHYNLSHRCVFPSILMVYVCVTLLFACEYIIIYNMHNYDQ